MAIIEGIQKATRADVDNAIAIARRRLDELETRQRAHLLVQRWRDAQELTLPIAAAHAWLADLQNFATSLSDDPVAKTEPVGAWLNLHETIRAEFDVMADAAQERPSPESAARLDMAWRVLAAFRADAYAATQDPRFRPEGTPGSPAAMRTIRRNPLERRAPVDRERWQHLLKGTSLAPV